MAADTLQPFRVDVVAFATAREALRTVRDEVFIAGQGVPEEIEHDALDPLCVHVLARLLDGTPVGAGRLGPDGRIGRMAVRRRWRGRGIGDALLLALLDEARRQDRKEVHLHAQAPAIGFYARHGFQPEGERFMEAGIEHQAMHRELAAPRRIASQEDAVAMTVAVIESARRLLWIRSHALDPGLLDAPEVIAALRGFATGGRRGAQVEVLLHDATAPQRAAAPLLALAQRLPSLFAFRELDDPVDRNDPAAFIASDGGGWFLRRLGQRFEGEAGLQGPAICRQLQARHAQGWERSRPVSEYRALGL